jgi:hypothetical protein
VANNGAAGASPGKRSKDGLGDVGELVELLKAYAKQETIGPLRGVGRYVGFGLAGSFLIAIGLVLSSFAGLRALQTETHAFDDGWSFVPYVIVIAADLLVAGLFVRRISKGDLDG